MAAVTILSDFGAQENKVCHHFHFPPSICNQVMGLDAMILGKNIGWGSHSLFQGIFLTQESNPGLLHCRWILYSLSHQGSPES